MGLIAGVMEEKGMRTVCLSTFERIMEQVRPPRRLIVPFPLGYPLGEPDQPEVQKKILRAALRLLDHPGPAPVRAELDPTTEET